ncbi:GAF sensor signal transduction histidine kinase [[Leptolyngbya] sp. PCC 7376]|uniref:GAF domain-containing sensor histidine kinase n=1 Tax=[Leptolyngbya] sp. PCC 7376 TaxID=111781 RepID=UPI00029F4292|nr:GAF domain-containing sensor histidine kinase [[Leptolyngbya] sp. PCC 7376]AFY38053.1 GAF sensor signal transduction histidine kinase [[Leptolyngbya] sp. PCC 7376]
MALDSLYRCLTRSSDPDVVVDNLAEAIAHLFSVEVVHIAIDRLTPEPLIGHYSKNPDLNGFVDLTPPTKAVIETKLKAKKYQKLKQQSIQEITLIPIETEDNGANWIGIGSFSSLPTLEEITSTVIPPLQLATQLLCLQQHKNQNHESNALLAQINQLIDAEMSINKLLQKAIAAMTDCYDVDFGIVGLFKYANPLLARNDRQTCPDATFNVVNETDILPQQVLLKDCTLCQRAWLLAPEILAIEKLGTDSTIASPLADDYQSFLVTPLMGQQSTDGQNSTIVGLIILGQQEPRAWQPQEKQLATFLAHQLSTAMIHQQSLQRVQTLVDERTAQLKWSLDVQAKLGAKMRQQIQQLRQLNVLKDEFLSTMSHELNTPLATMKVAVKMLKQPGRSPEKQATYLDILEQELTRESKLIKDLLKLQHFESEKFAIKPQRLVLKPILEGMQKEFNQRWQLLKGIELEINYTPENISQKLQIETDEESLSSALSELLTNAGKYSARNTKVRLEVEYLSKSPALVQLRLCNDGSGISVEEQEHIFEKFRRGAGVTDQAIPGTGLGLALVKALVEQLEGTIDVSSEPNNDGETHETCFVMTFPQSMVGL